MPHRDEAHAATRQRIACASLPCRRRNPLPHCARCRTAPPRAPHHCCAHRVRLAATPSRRSAALSRRAVLPQRSAAPFHRSALPSRCAAPSLCRSALPSRCAAPFRRAVLRGSLRSFARLVVLPPIPPPGHAIPPPGSPSRRSDAALPRRFATRRTNGKKITKTFQYSTVPETKSSLKD